MADNASASNLIVPTTNENSPPSADATNNEANSSSGGGVRNSDAIKKELKELADKRDILEAESDGAAAYLQTTPVGLKGRLVDEDGFPRADVDHYAVRGARNKLVCNKNDLGAIMEKMAALLEELHAVTRTEAVRSMGGEEYVKKAGAGNGKISTEAARTTNNSGGNKASYTTDAASAAPNLKPFLRVASVAPNSPAFTAGLREGDVIHCFGDATKPLDESAAVTYETFKRSGLALLGGFIRSREGQTVPMLVSTPEISTTLVVEHFIVPRRWSGGGLIGAEFDPLP